MVRLGCAGSIHGRLSIEEASSFFEKVQFHFQLANLLIQFVLLCVGLLADRLAAIAEDIRQTRQGLLLPTPHLRWVDTEHLCNLGRRLVRTDRFPPLWPSGQEARRVILSGLRH
jgi:hypothetical protein